MLSVFTYIVLFSATGSANTFNTAHGESKYLNTFSRLANIIGERNAQTKALSHALNGIASKCLGENFELLETNFSNGRFNGSSVIVHATVGYYCK